MAYDARELLNRIEQAILDEAVPTSSILNQCIFLGARAKSPELRDWATRELKGYGDNDELPPYRKIVAAICLDGLAGNAMVQGQCIGPEDLPAVAQECGIGNEVRLGQAIGDLEALSRNDSSIRVFLPDAPLLAKIMNAEKQTPFQWIESAYWSVMPETIAGVVAQVRTAITEFVCELDNSLPPGASPTSEATTQAVRLALGDIGPSASVTINTGQASGSATTSVGTSPTKSGHESWWVRWRKRGLIIGLATLISAVAGVGAWIGWNPFHADNPPAPSGNVEQTAPPVRQP